MVAGSMGYAAWPPFIVELRALCETIKIADYGLNMTNHSLDTVNINYSPFQ
jgi:hypothetical protein